MEKIFILVGRGPDPGKTGVRHLVSVSVPKTFFLF